MSPCAGGLWAVAADGGLGGAARGAQGVLGGNGGAPMGWWELGRVGLVYHGFSRCWVPGTAEAFMGGALAGLLNACQDYVGIPVRFDRCAGLPRGAAVLKPDRSGLSR